MPLASSGGGREYEMVVASRAAFPSYFPFGDGQLLIISTYNLTLHLFGCFIETCAELQGALRIFDARRRSVVPRFLLPLSLAL